MSSNEDGAADSAACGRASEAAREVLLEECGSQTFQVDITLRDEAKQQMQEEMGLIDQDDDPPCDRLLEEGFTSDNCTTFPNVQQLVYCMLFNEPPVNQYDQPLIDEFEGDRGRATQEAWRLHRRKCSGK